MKKKTPFRDKSSDESPGFLLYQLTSLWQQKLNQVFSRFDIYQTQYAILASLLYFEERGQSVSQSNLCDHAKIDKMTLSKAIRQLETRGLVLRRASEEDSRMLLVELTEAGRTLVAEAIVAVENADVEFFGALKPGELQMFQKLSLKLIRENG